MNQLDDFRILQAHRQFRLALGLLQDCEEALVHAYGSEGGLSVDNARKQAELVSEFLVSHGHPSIIDTAAFQSGGLTAWLKG